MARRVQIREKVSWTCQPRKTIQRSWVDQVKSIYGAKYC
jgi:hypothetical protein